MLFLLGEFNSCKGGRIDVDRLYSAHLMQIQEGTEAMMSSVNMVMRSVEALKYPGRVTCRK
jgi:hypothetical protein